MQELFLKNFIRLSVSFKRGYVILVKKKKRGTMLEKKRNYEDVHEISSINLNRDNLEKLSMDLLKEVFVFIIWKSI
jgi:hypothetical protein